MRKRRLAGITALIVTLVTPAAVALAAPSNASAPTAPAPRVDRSEPRRIGSSREISAKALQLAKSGVARRSCASHRAQLESVL